MKTLNNTQDLAAWFKQNRGAIKRWYHHIYMSAGCPFEEAEEEPDHKHRGEEALIKHMFQSSKRMIETGLIISAENDKIVVPDKPWTRNVCTCGSCVCTEKDSCYCSNCLKFSLQKIPRTP